MNDSIADRVDAIEQLHARLVTGAGGPTLLIGEPGIGRTTTLRRIAGRLDPDTHFVVATRPCAHAPFAAVAHLLPDGPPRHLTDAAVAAVCAELLRQADGRRLVALVDDAHRIDDGSMLALRMAHRTAHAGLVLTHPDDYWSPGAHDPVNCLRFEPQLGTVRLTGLSTSDVAAMLEKALGGPVLPATAGAVWSATGGNPLLVGELVDKLALAECTVRDERGHCRLDGPRAAGATQLSEAGSARLLAATARAWRELRLSEATELCRLARWDGHGDEVAAISVLVALLSGRTEQALRESEPADERPLPVMVRALCLALGAHRVDAAAALLADMALRSPHRASLTAYREWLLAACGRTADLSVLSDDGVDRRAALFSHAARAVAAPPADAVAHLRRALVLASGDDETSELPWLAPYLRAHLIDALLLSGRITEATRLAERFHAAAPTNDWTVALALTTLFADCGAGAQA